jgi:caa(3)-type oxidase subunit IV
MSDPHATETALADAAHHDASHDAAHIEKHLKGYYIVGGILIVFTGITVALSYVDFGSIRANWIIAMIVATFKVCLVGAIFMHLKGERWTIWQFLLFTAFFVAGLFLLTLFAWGDPIWGTYHATH